MPTQQSVFSKQKYCLIVLKNTATPVLWLQHSQYLQLMHGHPA
jgi:hypothetical protein